mmetsp:Transcript_31286/g.89749  ORF Transcript_31286/g.89749 Transcript_31286/m.89749 type:complete len:315 (-) Transcript_31286:318-1262(-)
MESVRLGEALGQHASDVGRDPDHAAAGDGVLLEADVGLDRAHEQHQRRVQPQHLHDRTPELRHLAVALEVEGPVIAPECLALLGLQLLNELWPAEDLEHGPCGRDRAVVHAAEKARDEEADDLLVRDRRAVGVGGAQGLPQEVVLLDLALAHEAPALLQHRPQRLGHLAPGRVAGPVPGDRGTRHEDGERQHALLEDVEQVADVVAGRGHVHPAPELVAHEAADGGPRQQLDHGRADVHLTLRALPLLIEELFHLRVQRAAVGREAVLGQALADEAELAHPRGVVRVVEHLASEDGDGEGVHLRLVQVLVVGEE